MARLLRRWWKDERGATAVEYGVLAVFMAVIVLSGVSLGLDSVAGVFNRVQTAFTAASP